MAESGGEGEENRGLMQSFQGMKHSSRGQHNETVEEAEATDDAAACSLQWYPFHCSSGLPTGAQQ